MTRMLAVSALVLVFATMTTGQSLPTGFSSDVLLTGLSRPVGMAFLPDGRLLITEQWTANIKVWTGSSNAVVGQVPNVTTGSERGLLGIDVDPGWPSRPFIYVFHSHTGSRTWLSMYTVLGDLSNPTSTNLSLGSRYDIITDIPDNAFNHNGGTCRFGKDGKLYVSMGDDGSSCTAQDTADLRGVILRIDVSKLPGTGSGPPPKSQIIPTGNPFAGPNDNARLTWCYGLRNPFRFDIDRVTGNLYIADVGWRTEEELDESKAGVGGENFGWPWVEGNTVGQGCGGSAPANVLPIARYNRNGIRSASIVSMTRYRNVLGGQYNFGNAYEGDAFYAEYYPGFVRRIKESAGKWGTPAPVPGQPSATDWATGIASIGDAAIGPDGAIYYVQLNAGRLGRIRNNPKLPVVTTGAQAKANQVHLVRSSRNPGDVILLAIGLQKVSPAPLPGFFGRVEMVPFPLVGGIADGSGNFDVPIPVPQQVIGITFYFQCVASAGADNYISALASTLVVP